jgi:drug/metabolite transporter (DMT)-like permease
MFVWRNALILGVIFIVVGVIYFFVQGSGTGTTSDRAGATMLVILGGAMAFAFAILLRGSREL